MYSSGTYSCGTYSSASPGPNCPAPLVRTARRRPVRVARDITVRRLRGVRVNTVRHSDGSRKVTWVRVRVGLRTRAAGR